jgi:hypothetical protein
MCGRGTSRRWGPGQCVGRDRPVAEDRPSMVDDSRLRRRVWPTRCGRPADEAGHPGRRVILPGAGSAFWDRFCGWPGVASAGVAPAVRFRSGRESWIRFRWAAGGPATSLPGRAWSALPVRWAAGGSATSLPGRAWSALPARVRSVSRIRAGLALPASVRLALRVRTGPTRARPLKPNIPEISGDARLGSLVVGAVEGRATVRAGKGAGRRTTSLRGVAPEPWGRLDVRLAGGARRTGPASRRGAGSERAGSHSRRGRWPGPW